MSRVISVFVMRRSSLVFLRRDIARKDAVEQKTITEHGQSEPDQQHKRQYNEKKAYMEEYQDTGDQVKRCNQDCWWELSNSHKKRIPDTLHNADIELAQDGEYIAQCNNIEDGKSDQDVVQEHLQSCGQVEWKDKQPAEQEHDDPDDSRLPEVTFERLEKAFRQASLLIFD